jgi:hypothetical protein
MPRYRVTAPVTAMVEIIIEADSAAAATERFGEQIMVNAGLADDEEAEVVSDSIYGLGAIRIRLA